MDPQRKEFAYEEEVSSPTQESEVKRVIISLKSDRAAGADDVLAAMMMGTSSKMITLLTLVTNESLADGCVLGLLQTGKSTLIDKKEPSLDDTKKRPITVSSVVLSIITKMIHKCRNAICECEVLYGPVEYGFRRKRSRYRYG